MGQTELSVMVIVVVTEVVGSVLKPFFSRELLKMNTVFFTGAKCFLVFITIELMANSTQRLILKHFYYLR